MLWSLLSISLFLVLLSSFFSSSWLITPVLPGKSDEEFDTHKTFGLFSVCDVKVNKKTEYKIQTCKLFYSMSHMPGYWVACCFFIGFSLLLTTLVGVLGFASVCYRRVRGCSKSIFAVAGLMQAIAGLFLIFPPFLFPLGWANELVQHDCTNSTYYNIGSCSLGVAFYGVLLCLLSTCSLSLLSRHADKSTRKRRVERDVDRGRNPVCGGF